jgi:hypothetical protein
MDLENMHDLESKTTPLLEDCVVIESDIAVAASVFVMVEQGSTS